MKRSRYKLNIAIGIITVLLTLAFGCSFGVYYKQYNQLFRIYTELYTKHTTFGKNFVCENTEPYPTYRIITKVPKQMLSQSVAQNQMVQQLNASSNTLLQRLQVEETADEEVEEYPEQPAEQEFEYFTKILQIKPILKDLVLENLHTNDENYQQLFNQYGQMTSIEQIDSSKIDPDEIDNVLMITSAGSLEYTTFKNYQQEEEQLLKSLDLIGLKPDSKIDIPKDATLKNQTGCGIPYSPTQQSILIDGDVHLPIRIKGNVKANNILTNTIDQNTYQGDIVVEGSVGNVTVQNGSVDGNISIQKGVSGNITVQEGVSGNITISNGSVVGDIVVQKGVSGNITISETGVGGKIHIMGNVGENITTTDDATDEGTVYVKGDVKGHKNGINIEGNVKADGNGIQLSKGIEAGGHGISILDGGIKSNMDGLYIKNGGIDAKHNGIYISKPTNEQCAQNSSLLGCDHAVKGDKGDKDVGNTDGNYSAINITGNIYSGNDTIHVIGNIASEWNNGINITGNVQGCNNNKINGRGIYVSGSVSGYTGVQILQQVKSSYGNGISVGSNITNESLVGIDAYENAISISKGISTKNRAGIYVSGDITTTGSNGYGVQIDGNILSKNSAFTVHKGNLETTGQMATINISTISVYGSANKAKYGKVINSGKGSAIRIDGDVISKDNVSVYFNRTIQSTNKGGLFIKGVPVDENDASKGVQAIISNDKAIHVDGSLNTYSSVVLDINGDITRNVSYDVTDIITIGGDVKVIGVQKKNQNEWQTIASWRNGNAIHVKGMINISGGSGVLIDGGINLTNAGYGASSSNQPVYYGMYAKFIDTALTTSYSNPTISPYGIGVGWIKTHNTSIIINNTADNVVEEDGIITQLPAIQTKTFAIQVNGDIKNINNNDNITPKIGLSAEDHYGLYNNTINTIEFNETYKGIVTKYALQNPLSLINITGNVIAENYSFTLHNRSDYKFLENIPAQHIIYIGGDVKTLTQNNITNAIYIGGSVNGSLNGIYVGGNITSTYSGTNPNTTVPIKSECTVDETTNKSSCIITNDNKKHYASAIQVGNITNENKQVTQNNTLYPKYGSAYGLLVNDNVMISTNGIVINGLVNTTGTSQTNTSDFDKYQAFLKIKGSLLGNTNGIYVNGGINLTGGTHTFHVYKANDSLKHAITGNNILQIEGDAQAKNYGIHIKGKLTTMSSRGVYLVNGVESGGVAIQVGKDGDGIAVKSSNNAAIDITGKVDGNTTGILVKGDVVGRNTSGVNITGNVQNIINETNISADNISYPCGVFVKSISTPENSISYGLCVGEYINTTNDAIVVYGNLRTSKTQGDLKLNSQIYSKEGNGIRINGTIYAGKTGIDLNGSLNSTIIYKVNNRVEQEGINYNQIYYENKTTAIQAETGINIRGMINTTETGIKLNGASPYSYFFNGSWFNTSTDPDMLLNTTRKYIPYVIKSKVGLDIHGLIDTSEVGIQLEREQVEQVEEEQDPVYGGVFRYNNSFSHNAITSGLTAIQVNGDLNTTDATTVNITGTVYNGYYLEYYQRCLDEREVITTSTKDDDGKENITAVYIKKIDTIENKVYHYSKSKIDGTGNQGRWCYNISKGAYGLMVDEIQSINTSVMLANNITSIGYKSNAIYINNGTYLYGRHGALQIGSCSTLRADDWDPLSMVYVGFINNNLTNGQWSVYMDGIYTNKGDRVITIDLDEYNAQGICADNPIRFD